MQILSVSCDSVVYTVVEKCSSSEILSKIEKQGHSLRRVQRKEALKGTGKVYTEVTKECGGQEVNKHQDRGHLVVRRRMAENTHKGAREGGGVVRGSSC